MLLLAVIWISCNTYLKTVESTRHKKHLQICHQNDHFDVVKCLYNNGATKKLNDNKIGVIFLNAMATKNKEMIYYLDKALNVPYHEIYNNEIKGSKKRNTLIKNEHFDKITFGDMFMHKVFLYEDQELTNFLLDKKCTFDLFNAQNVLKKVSKSFADFLVQKRLGSKQSNSDINDEIVSAIEAGN
ncbi:hypothetical protein M9Y10_018347 [Tritrichomonas musculus]|uniref:Ankyrin repeat-containing protein n=1 Tax=Tritrichomonas musculus TaxID=1915356 RepID=A0ABR2HPW0_9EUKA